MNADAARSLLKHVHFCVLSTSTLEGQPWVSPLFYNYSPDLRFVWESEKTARHSELLTANPRVAIVIADFEADDPTQSLYIEAMAREVPSEELSQAVDVFWHGPHKKHDRGPLSEADYRGEAPLRLYEARIGNAYVLVQDQVEGGHAVERREEIALT